METTTNPNYFPRNYRTTEIDGHTIERRTIENYVLQYRIDGGTWYRYESASYQARSLGINLNDATMAFERGA